MNIGKEQNRRVGIETWSTGLLTILVLVEIIRKKDYATT